MSLLQECYALTCYTVISSAIEMLREFAPYEFTVDIVTLTPVYWVTTNAG